MSLTLHDVCGCIQVALTVLHFSFSSLQSYLFSGLRLFLLALDRLKASVRIPKQLRDGAANKEDYYLSLKTRTAISGGVSLNDLPHFELLVPRRRPFIPHPRGGPESGTEGRRVSRAFDRLGTKSIAH